MTPADAATLRHAAEVIDQYADALRRSHVVNGAWSGKGVTKIRDEWGDLVRTARRLREMAG